MMPREKGVSHAGCSHSGKRAVPDTVASASLATSPAGCDRLTAASPVRNFAASQPE